MNHRCLFRLFVVAALLAVPSGASGADTVVIKGSTTLLPIAQAAAEAFIKKNPQINISLSGGGSGDGVKALIDKTADIANSSREMKKEEIALAKSRGVKPVEHRVAIDAIVPVVHPSNPVQDLTLEQLSLVYQGKISNWKELGGADKRITVISRDTSSGTYEAWSQKVLHNAKVTPRAQLQASNGAIVQTVSRNRYAVGYIGIGYLNPSVKPLKVNGVEASPRTALSGKFPVARPLYMFTDEKPKKAAADFIRFILSPEGRKIIEKTGFVPLK